MQNFWFWALIRISIENLRQIEEQEIGESIELKRKEYFQMHTGIDSFLRAPNETEWILQLEHKRRESIDEKNETEDSFQFVEVSTFIYTKQLEKKPFIVSNHFLVKWTIPSYISKGCGDEKSVAAGRVNTVVHCRIIRVEVIRRHCSKVNLMIFVRLI